MCPRLCVCMRGVCVYYVIKNHQNFSFLLPLEPDLYQHDMSLSNRHVVKWTVSQCTWFKAFRTTFQHSRVVILGVKLNVSGSYFSIMLKRSSNSISACLTDWMRQDHNCHTTTTIVAAIPQLTAKNIIPWALYEPGSARCFISPTDLWGKPNIFRWWNQIK